MSYGVPITGRDNPLGQNPHAPCTRPHDGKSVAPIALRIGPELAALVVNIALLTLRMVLYKFTLLWTGGT